LNLAAGHARPRLSLLDLNAVKTASSPPPRKSAPARIRGTRSPRRNQHLAKCARGGHLCLGLQPLSARPAPCSPGAWAPSRIADYVAGLFRRIQFLSALWPMENFWNFRHKYYQFNIIGRPGVRYGKKKNRTFTAPPPSRPVGRGLFANKKHGRISVKNSVRCDLMYAAPGVLCGPQSAPSHPPLLTLMHNNRGPYFIRK